MLTSHTYLDKIRPQPAGLYAPIKPGDSMRTQNDKQERKRKEGNVLFKITLNTLYLRL